MSANVSPATVAKATRCARDHACVRSGADYRCPIEEIVGDEVVFVAYLPQVTCSYRSSFGEGFVCNCPVRREACCRPRS